MLTKDLRKMQSDGLKTETNISPIVCMYDKNLCKDMKEDLN